MQTFASASNLPLKESEPLTQSAASAAAAASHAALSGVASPCRAAAAQRGREPEPTGSWEDSRDDEEKKEEKEAEEAKPSILEDQVNSTGLVEEAKEEAGNVAHNDLEADADATAEEAAEEAGNVADNDLEADAEATAEEAEEEVGNVAHNDLEADAEAMAEEAEEEAGNVADNDLEADAEATAEDAVSEGADTPALEQKDSPGSYTSTEDTTDEEDLPLPEVPAYPSRDPAASAAVARRLRGPFDSRQTLIFFDWDDTLMPTHWLTAPGGLQSGIQGPKRKEESEKMMKELAEHAKETLFWAQEFGKVVIVTKATIDWVERTCRNFAPELIPMLDGLTTISARHYGEDAFVLTTAPNGKAKVFRKVAEEYFQDLPEEMVRNVMSIGDSLTEFEALISLRKVLPPGTLRTKGVKLVSKPKAWELLQEHRFLLLYLHQLVGYTTSFRFDLDPSGMEP